jgi:hypothetical protein
MAETQRLLTAWEMTSFLARHPIEAAEIAETKTAILTGLYDWTQGLPGMIPPWGQQVTDSYYDLVTVYFGTDGTLYLSGWSEPIGDVNKPAYVPPVVKCKNGQDPILGVCPEDLTAPLGTLALFGVGLAVFVGYQMFFAKKRA